MAKLFAALLLIAVSFVGANGAHAEKRVATLIGNSAYSGELQLPNPGSDVRLLEKRLKSLGFDVRVYTDVDSRSIGMLIDEHGSRLASAGTSAVGFFVYAGHAVQIDGENFLLGVDFKGSLSTQDRFAPAASVSAGLISDKIGAAGNRINFIVLDACRDDPTGKGGAGSGLARMDAPRGALLAYSTSPGQRALDGQGGLNSPYAQALDAALGESGLTAEQVFRRTRDRVVALTAGRQTPWESSSLLGDDFYFNGGKMNTAEAARRRVEDEKALWDTVGDSNDVAMLQTYLASYPGGNFATLARRKINEISQAEDKARQLRLLGEAPRAGVSVGGQAAPARQDANSTFALDGKRLVGADRNLGVNLGVVLEGSNAGGAFQARVREVSERSPFFGKLAVGDEITRINRQPVAEASLAYALEEAFSQQRRVDLVVKRGTTPYAFSYVEPKRMGN